jgi:hypothetical protein
MESSLALFMAGALSAGYAVVALFFARFWRDTHDRLFSFFAVAFVLLSLQRVALAVTGGGGSWAVPLYGIRLLAFLLILYAIVDKNRTQG